MELRDIVEFRFVETREYKKQKELTDEVNGLLAHGWVVVKVLVIDHAQVDDAGVGHRCEIACYMLGRPKNARAPGPGGDPACGSELRETSG